MGQLRSNDQYLLIYKKINSHMLNFSSLFGQFRSQSGNNALNQLLDQPSIKMGRLLDQDSFINEYKSGNTKVADFMKYEKFEELLEFVTVVGPADDKKRSFKYPLSACDMLSIDNNTAVELFFPDRPITVDQIVTQEEEFQIEVQVEQIVEPTPPVETVEDKPAEVPQEEEKPKQQEQNQQKPVVQEQVKPQQAPIVVQQAQEKQPQKRMKKEIRKEKRRVDKVLKKEVQPLIGKLMAYFDGQINYTLAGYVSKILTTFFNKKQANFLRYILQENVAKKVLNHAQSRSVGDLIVKILINETTICLQERKSFFKSILDKLSTSDQVHIMSNLSSYVCQVIEKIALNLKGNNKIVQFNDIFFSIDAITQVIKNVINEDENVSIYNAPILFTYLTSVPLVLPEDEAVLEEFKKLLEHFIQKSCEKLNVNTTTRPKIGTGRIKIIQILRFILKENILNTKDIIGNTDNFFPILLNLMREYPMNNLLHNEIAKIIQTALTESETTALNKAILKDNILLNFIRDEAEQDKKIRGGFSVYKSRKGFIAHLINLSIRIREISETNPALKASIDGSDFTKVYDSFIEKEIYNTKKTLAGFSMRKDIKHEIMFQKQDIIAQYMTFLQKCPSPVFEKEPQHINIEHPDLVEQLQKQLEQNLTIKPATEQQKQKPAEPVPIIEDDAMPAEEYSAVGTGKFWAVHLQYNIDDLMAGL